MLDSTTDLPGEIRRAAEAVANRTRDVNPRDILAVRRAYDAFAENDPLPEMAGQADLSMGGVPCLGMMPKGSNGEHIILWLHGGGYSNGSSRSHKGLVSHIASRAGSCGVIPDYRLAPEHVFPAAIDDAVAVYKAVLAEGVEARHIVLAGDSAGGGLAVAAALRLRDEGQPRPCGLMLASPWVDLSNSGWSHVGKAERDPFLSKAGLDAAAKRYLGQASATATEAAPLLADLRGLPPTYIQVGEAEILLSDSTRLAERLGASGVPVSLEIWPDMFHVFQARYTMLRHARQAMVRMGDWAKAHINQ